MAKKREVLPLFRVFYNYTAESGKTHKFSTVMPAEDADSALRKVEEQFRHEAVNMDRVEFLHVYPDVLS